MSTSNTIGAIAEALAKAQGEMSNAAKDTKNPFFSSTYADLASVWTACRKPLADNSLAVTQLPEYDGVKVSVETILMHSSGEWISSTVSLTPGYTAKDGTFVKRTDPQSIGSALTYARRYALSAIVGIAPEDDDGNAASRGNGHHEEAPPPAQARPAAQGAKPAPQAVSPPVDPAFQQLNDRLRIAMNSLEQTGGDLTAHLKANYGGRKWRDLTREEQIGLVEAYEREANPPPEPEDAKAQDGKGGA